MISKLEKEWKNLKKEKEDYIKNVSENNIKKELTISHFNHKMEKILKKIVELDEMRE